jgi:uncharacterized membrane protein YdbT with pleckstrin-like domain
MKDPYKINIGKQIGANLLSQVFGLPIILILIIGFGFGVIFAPFPGNLIFLGFILLIILFNLIGPFITYLYLRSIDYELDERNFIFRGGIIGRFERIVPFSKIQHVTINENLSGRIMGIASVSIEDASQAMGYRENTQNANIPGSDKVIPALLKVDALKLRNELLKLVLKTNSGQGI